MRPRGKETKLGIVKMGFEVFPERCDRGKVSYLEGERVPKNGGVVTKRIRIYLLYIAISISSLVLNSLVLICCLNTPFLSVTT